MKGIDAYEKNIEERINFLRAHFERHRPILEWIHTLAEKWSTNEDPHYGRYVIVTYSPDPMGICCVALDCYLGKDDTVEKDFNLFLEEHVEPFAKWFGLDRSVSNSYLKWGWTGMEYFNGYSFNRTKLLVRAFFQYSNKCHLVPTGEVEEKMKLVCDE